MTHERVCEVFLLIAKLAAALGVQSIKDLPGLWEHQIDERWKLRLNGHTREIDGVPPYNALLEFDGWPAGVIHPYGGEMLNMSGVNESALCDALLAAIAKVGAPA